MKRLNTISMMALTVIGLMTELTACGDDDKDDPIDPTPSVSVTLASQSISEGEEVDAKATTQLLLSYSTTVTVTATASVTLNGAAVTASRNPRDVKGIIIPLALEEGTSYTLQMTEGSVVANSDATAKAPAFTLHFTTKAKAQPAANIPTAPVTATTEAAKQLYTFFYNNYGKKVVSSVMADVNWNHRIADKVHTLTGKYPAMNCFDFIHIYVPNQGSNGWIDYTDITPVKEWADAGGIVQLMWHFNVPVNETTTPGVNGSGVTCTPSETTFKASNALKDGTWENKWFYQQMDNVISVILQLQEAGIAATWRPFHEAAGNAMARQQANWTKAWFWWGYEGADTFKKLWQTMYTYFKQKGVENLIWIWTTQNYNGNSLQYAQDTTWYPGDDYVDMVARDLYGSTATQNAQEFEEIQSTYPNKMVVLGECGNGNNSEQGRISECWAQGALWGHFMVWYQGGQGSTDTMCSDDWWRDAMQSDCVITREQLPSLK